MNIIEEIDKEQIAKLNKTIPPFQPGDTPAGQRQGHRRRSHPRPAL